jgi:hypothetical protein
LLTKEVIPVPSEVKLPAPRTGLALVLQQTPFTVMGDPPSLVMAPPETAVVAAIPVIAAVDVTIGVVAAVVVKVNSFPKVV